MQQPEQLTVNKPRQTRAQTQFLRAFHLHPAGPPPKDWPSPAILRRWLRRGSIRDALISVKQTWRFQSDIHLAAATNSATQLLHRILVWSAENPSELQLYRSQMHHTLSLLRFCRSTDQKTQEEENEQAWG